MADGQEPTNNPNQPEPGQNPDGNNQPGQDNGQPTMVDLNATGDDGRRLYFEAGYVQELRTENADVRRQLRGVQAQLDRLQTPANEPPANNPPANNGQQNQPAIPDEWAQRLEALEARLTERDQQVVKGQIDTAILEAAARADGDRRRFIDPADAVRLVDRSSIQAQDGTVSGVVEALNALAEAKPHLLETRRGAPNTGASNPAGSGAPASSVVDRIKARYGVNSNNNPFAAGQNGGVVLPE